ncbi:MAG: oligosaccharide flippase family protein, partial [Clostridia bacterium]|nr:oligosaccharide flippase family protein [Clostridia bacterium]
MKTVYKTALTVTAFSLAEKFLGFLYRIYLSRTIGSEGIGLYQIPLSVFAACLTLSCSGIPATVTRLITKYRSEKKGYKVNGVVSAGISVTVIISGLISALLLLFPSAFGFLFSDKRCAPLFTLILPVLTLNAVYSVLRGVFWGNRDFLPYSVIELTEEAVMIVAGIFLISHTETVYDGAKSAIVAVVISYVVSFSLGTALFIYRGGRLSSPKKELKPLLTSSLPITVMRSANSFISSFVSVMLPAKLVEAGMGTAEATSAFGAFYGLSMPLLYAPMSLIGPFTIVLIPQIAESFYKGDEKNLKSDVEKAITLSVFLSSVVVPVFLCFGEEFGVVLFDSIEGGIYTSRSAPLMILLCLSSLTTSILNSVGEEHKTLLYFVISNAFLILSVLFLPRYIGIYSLLVGNLLLFFVNVLLNMRLIRKKTGVKIKFGGFAFLSIVFIVPSS